MKHYRTGGGLGEAKLDRRTCTHVYTDFTYRQRQQKEMADRKSPPSAFLALSPPGTEKNIEAYWGLCPSSLSDSNVLDYPHDPGDSGHHGPRCPATTA